MYPELVPLLAGAFYNSFSLKGIKFVELTLKLK